MGVFEKCEIFALFSQNQLRSLYLNSHSVSYSRREAVFVQGEAVRDAYLVVHGEFAVHKRLVLVDERQRFRTADDLEAEKYFHAQDASIFLLSKIENY